MITLSVAALGFVTYRSLSGLHVARLPLSTLTALPLLLLFQPIRDTISFGQINMVLMALVFLDLGLLNRNSRWAGVFIGLAAATKLTPALFILLLVVVGQRRAALTATTTAFAGSLLAFLVQPSTSIQYWSQTLFEQDRVGRVDSATNQALSGALARLVDGAQAPVVAWLTSVALVLLLVAVVSRRRWERGDRLTPLVMTGVACQLVSPIGWTHHLVWIAPAALVLVLNSRRVARFLSLGLLAVMTSGAPDLVRMTTHHHHELGPLGVLAESSYTLCALVALVLLARTRPVAPVAVPAQRPEPFGRERLSNVVRDNLRGSPAARTGASAG